MASGPCRWLPARLRRTNGPAPRPAPAGSVQLPTTSGTLPAGATPRQAWPAAGYELSSRAHELSSNGVELLPKAGQPQPSPRAGARRAPCAPGRPRDGPTSADEAGARRRGRHERRHPLADAAERVPPESRRGVAGGRRPDARHHAPKATDGAELRIIGDPYEAPDAPGAKRLNAAERSPPQRRACGRPRRAACRRRVRAPGAGARTGKTGECKRRDDRGDRMDHPIIGKLRLRRAHSHSPSQGHAAGPFKEARWAAWRASSLAVARRAGQRSSVRSRRAPPRPGHAGITCTVPHRVRTMHARPGALTARCRASKTIVHDDRAVHSGQRRTSRQLRRGRDKFRDAASSIQPPSRHRDRSPCSERRAQS